MMDKKILVTRSSMPDLDEYINEIRELWDTHWLTNMGVKHEELKKRLRDHLGVKNLELMVNGHMALEMSLQVLGLKGEVITTPFTFASTTHAIVRNGLTPVFCDIDPADFTIDISKIEALITERTCAILPVHVYGNICRVEEIGAIAKKHGLKVIYDAAHTFGETYKGEGAGSFGDISIFSFHATKVYNTIEGGAVCFKDPALGIKLNELRDFGIKDEETVTGIGANAKMNEFAAAMGLCNLRHVDGEIEKRRKAFDRYFERLDGIKGIRLPVDQPDVKRNFGYFPVVFDAGVFGFSRDDVFERLAEKGISARKYFYPLTNEFDCYKGMYRAETPEALKISKQVLTLPIYAGLSEDDVDRICDVIINME